MNDSHAQLMVHWLGEGTSVMICLARDPPVGPYEDPQTTPPPSPSTSNIFGNLHIFKFRTFGH